MNFLQYLREQRVEPVSVIHQFTLAYKASTKDIYIFFEGNDDYSFYMPLLRQQWSNAGHIHAFKCKGKSGVLDAYRRTRGKLDNIRRALFFIDKDFDDFLCIRKPNCKCIFRTSVYSIENYLVNENSLRIICSELMHLDQNDPRLNTIMNEFSRLYESWIQL